MSKLSQTSSSDGDFSADRLGRIKVLVVGNSGCGKTTLTHLLTDNTRTPRTHPTCGCNVALTVMKYPQDRAKQFPNLAGQEFFLELWDVGAQPRYEALRGLFYQGVNGVMLVHDLCQSRSLPSLQNWAAEVSQLGSFQAPYSEDRAALNLGGLPVPCLVVGNKQDLVGKHRCRHAPPRREQMWTALQKPASRLWGCLAAALRRGSSSPASSEVAHARSSSFGLSSLPKETLLHGNLQASALRGDLDMHAVTSFFCTLIERRYCPSFQCLAEDCLAGTACLAGADGAGALSPIVTRLSAERLPPVMYNAISEESSPYSSINHTPFSSCSSLNHAGGSGNWGTWLQTVPERAQSLHSAPSWQHPEQQAQQAQQEQRAGLSQQQGHAQQQPAGAPRAPSPLGFSGVNVALRLQGPGATDQAQMDVKGKIGADSRGSEGVWLGKIEAARPVVFESA